ncbi:MAG TPA: cysteine synthase family protein [Chitinispirillaceae bacterium]|nr:cysteine synthase family protein [Chitinispirillaceae bacterium]
MAVRERSVLDAIGNTPLVTLKRIWDTDATGVRLLVKIEGANPGGSIKDRPALQMIRNAIDTGLLTKDKIILEPTSGNTGIGMAMVAAALGYKIKLLMPSCVSEERRSILSALGAEVELTPGCDRTDGAIRRAHHIYEQNADLYYMPDQFSNDANWQAHYCTTAPEIIRDTDGDVDVLVAGMGTTGTLMGCSRYFREQKFKTKVTGIEPVVNHRIQGLKNMSEAIVPPIFDKSLLDNKFTCRDDDAFDVVRDLAIKEGLFCGISSGAAVWGAITAAKDLPRGSTVCAILPDRGDRYLSTNIFRSVCAECPP